VHITYPKGGFFWNEGNVVTTRTMRVDHESLRMTWPGSMPSAGGWTTGAEAIPLRRTQPARPSSQRTVRRDRLWQRSRWPS
jgi:hypothetical protein